MFPLRFFFFGKDHSCSVFLSLFVSHVPFQLNFNGDSPVCVDEWLLVYVIISLNMLNIVSSFICGFSHLIRCSSYKTRVSFFLFSFWFALTLYNDDHDLVIWFRHFYRRKQHKHTHTKHMHPNDTHLWRRNHPYSGDSQIRRKRQELNETPKFMNGT